jgi:hypothetical protein
MIETCSLSSLLDATYSIPARALQLPCFRFRSLQTRYLFRAACWFFPRDPFAAPAATAEEEVSRFCLSMGIHKDRQSVRVFQFLSLLGVFCAQPAHMMLLPWQCSSTYQNPRGNVEISGFPPRPGKPSREAHSL